MSNSDIFREDLENCGRKENCDDCCVKPLCSYLKDKPKTTCGAIRGYFHQETEYNLFDGDRVRFTDIGLVQAPPKLKVHLSGDQYQKLAMRTNDGKATMRLAVADSEASAMNIDFGGVIAACMGLSGEVGEVNDLMKKFIFHEKEFDETHLKKELGDVCWYIALMCESFGWNLDDILQMNIEKLKDRYPEGFDTDRANHRKEGDI